MSACSTIYIMRAAEHRAVAAHELLERDDHLLVLRRHWGSRSHSQRQPADSSRRRAGPCRTPECRGQNAPRGCRRRSGTVELSLLEALAATKTSTDSRRTHGRVRSSRTTRLGLRRKRWPRSGADVPRSRTLAGHGVEALGQQPALPLLTTHQKSDDMTLGRSPAGELKIVPVHLRFTGQWT